MQRRIRFYSDDSYSTCVPCGRKRFHAVVAGVAIEPNRTNVHRSLLEAERLSKKQLSDWRRTRPESARERYIDAVLDVPGLQARIFYCPFDSLGPSEYWLARLETLVAAIAVFTPGNCHHRMAHEGLQSNTRRQLRIDLMNRGCDGVTVESAQFHAEPEVRLSDAIAGYVRGELYRGDGQRAVLTNIPHSFVNLEPKIRNPPDRSGG
jgi:hypothetical protein